MTRFLHFGCWNENGCETNTDLKKTMDALKNHILKNEINFVVIAGDNYYSEKTGKKENKVKNINSKMLYSGIKCLINALSAKDNIEKYILLGNHEYDDIKNIDNVNYDFMKCHIFKQQKNIFEDLPYSYFFTDVMEKKIGSTLILFIDSTIYEEENDKKIDDTCFRNIFKNITKDGVLTIKDLCDYQKEKVVAILNKEENKDIKNLIVIAHHPITSVKYKKRENKREELNGLIDLYKTIYDKLINKTANIYHLCADTHTYQSGDIIIEDGDKKIKITQHICGTGGAHKDECPRQLKDKKEKKYIIKDYNIIECKEVNGFLDVIIIDDKIEFNLIEAEKSDEVEKFNETKQQVGYYNKYLKYKQKYLKLKQSLNY